MDGLNCVWSLMPERSWQFRLATLFEILLALGPATDWLALLVLAPFPRLANPLASVESLAAVITLSSLLLIVLLALLQRARGERVLSFFPAAGREIRRDTVRGLVLVLPIFASVCLLKSGFRYLLPGVYSGERNLLEELMKTPVDLALFLSIALFTGGVKEEMQRAFVIRRFEAGWGPGWLGALLYAVFFGLGHRIQGTDEAVIAAVLGLVWGLIFVTRRSIVTPLVSHALYDAVELVRYYAFGPMRYL